MCLCDLSDLHGENDPAWAIDIVELGYAPNRKDAIR